MQEWLCVYSRPVTHTCIETRTLQILLGERAHLIEFPSVLLPPGASAGSIVNISVHQNHAEEEKRDNEFWSLQEDILQEYGQHLPAYPELQVRYSLLPWHYSHYPTNSFLATTHYPNLRHFRMAHHLASKGKAAVP